MKNNVKKFNEFVNESEYEYGHEGRFGSDLGKKHRGLAVWEIGDSWSQVSYGEQSIDITETDADYNEDGEFIGYDKIFSAADELGADPDMVYSVEDDQVLHRSDLR